MEWLPTKLLIALSHTDLFSKAAGLRGMRADHAEGDENTGPPGGLSALANTCTPGYAVTAVVEYLVL